MKSYQATIIVPCAGRSQFFGEMPKFLTVDHFGNPMVVEAISKLNIARSRLIISVLREHEKRHHIRAMFKKFFSKYPAEICVLPASLGSQSGDVYQTLNIMKVRGPFLSKDSDNIFRMDHLREPYNYVAVESLENLELVNARDKSYVATDASGLITAIEEKKVISNIFSMGGYYFLDPGEFISAYEVLHRRHGKSGIDLYISRIISYLILERGAKFKIKPVSECVDFGTVEDWLRYTSKYKAYFVDLDGILVERGGEFFQPLWSNTRVVKKNAEVVRALYKEGNQIIITTSRKESYRAETARQLKKFRIPYHALIMDLYDSEKVLVSDFSEIHPYPSARAVSVPADESNLGKYLGRS